jgi:hypothetical protein
MLEVSGRLPKWRNAIRLASGAASIRQIAKKNGEIRAPHIPGRP